MWIIVLFFFYLKTNDDDYILHYIDYEGQLPKYDCVLNIESECIKIPPVYI